MCDKRSSVEMWAIMQVKTIRVDNCMREFITYLNSHNIKTLGCCCGHGYYPMTVVVQDTGTNNIFELLSGVKIPRKKLFYKMDSDGLYYIPEIVGVMKSG